MSDNTKLIEAALRCADDSSGSMKAQYIKRLAAALEAAERCIEFLEEQDAGLREDIGNLDNQLRDLSKLIWDYDEWEALARNGNEPAVAVYKLHQVMTEPHA